MTFHTESEMPDGGVDALIDMIKAGGMAVGVTLKPSTPIEEILPICDKIDLVLIMTVNPGFGGQSFMPEMMSKVKTIRKKYPYMNIQVDGGLGPKTIDVAAEAGANVIVAGSSVYGADDPKVAIETLRTAVNKVCLAQ